MEPCRGLPFNAADQIIQDMTADGRGEPPHASENWWSFGFLVAGI